MTFVKIDDGFIDHPKFLEAGPLAGYLALCAIAWSGRNAADGFIPRPQVPRLCYFDGIILVDDVTVHDHVCDAPTVNPFDLAERLVSVGLWESRKHGFQIHDYLEYQSSRKEIEAARAKERARWKARQDAVNAA